ncbi:hypothetical protein BUALT_Bualt15G0066200 [Buddleja alternifolia]|uniref:NB-ARC domain-containing protein n=1 Tax=Buddleja alternifolia TaxID=168488 RepID=A0AAV6WB99_9LAMI|nr:hypothetical protein BUALT_Bualt15G0066200 [Buddleja alternifolia]
MVGFDEQLKTIKGHLCGESSKLQVIPIIGMGGIGKTILARNAFDDDLIAYHFHIRLWVTISQDYHMQRVLRSIEDSINVANREKPEVDEGDLLGYIYKHLKGMSRIMLTTRLSDVAHYAGTLGSLHQVQFLNEEQSWNLFREKVFGQEHCPRELEYPGKSVANHCRGLPLAIVMVAGLLSKVNKTQYDWMKIACNVSSVVTSSNDEHVAKILSLSYNHLPHHLKPCFLYMGVFPEDYENSASRLVKLWIAEGFVRPIESRSLEEVGKEYLKDLVSRNLVLLTKKRYVWATTLYLSPIIPLDARVAGKVHLLENLQTLSSVTNFTFTNEILEMILNLKTLKVLSNGPKNKWQQLCNNLDHLLQLETLTIRFLDLETVGVHHFPESFAFPRNFKELSLRGCRLPWKDMTLVGSLPKLEVLKLCTHAVDDEVWEPIEGEFLQLKFLLLKKLSLKHWRVEDIHFPRLEHLHISWCGRLKSIPLEIGEIPTLKLIKVHNNTSVADSAMEIQQEQRSLGNDTLQVRVYDNNW